MAVNIQRVSLEDFEAFVNLPENADKLFEFIRGEIVEVPSNPYSSEIAANVIFFIKLYLRDHNVAGHVTGEAGGYMVGGDRYAPDVAFVSKDRQAHLATEGYNPVPPDLAVEVLSPTDDLANVRMKIANYTHVGTTVWLIDPEKQTVEIYAPDAPATRLDNTETLDGGTVLPGFSLPVKDIFTSES